MFCFSKQTKRLFFRISKMICIQIKLCLFVLCFCYSSLFGDNTEIKKLFDHASEEELAELERFSSSLLAGTVSGYVLYGDKPIGWLNLQALTSDYPFTMDYQISLSVLKGLKLWKKFQLPLSSKNYILHIHEEDQAELGFSYLLCINRKAFHAVFLKNELLFKYILGPEINAEALLSKITDPKEDFFKIIKNDVVLIGILLGFGAENALYTSRLELIQSLRNEDNQLSQAEPSFGYHSLEEEYEDVMQKLRLCSEVLDEQLPVICFGCDPTKKRIPRFGEPLRGCSIKAHRNS